MANTEDQIYALFTGWHKAITSRDGDALVQLTFGDSGAVRQRQSTPMTSARNESGTQSSSRAERPPW